MVPESRHTRTVITGIAGQKTPGTYCGDIMGDIMGDKVRGAMATQECYERDL